jgi:hypothetical protein
MNPLNSRPFIAPSIGCMIVVNIPKRPAASPEKKTDAPSAHSSAVIPTPSIELRPTLSRDALFGQGTAGSGV